MRKTEGAGLGARRPGRRWGLGCRALRAGEGMGGKHPTLWLRDDWAGGRARLEKPRLGPRGPWVDLWGWGRWTEGAKTPSQPLVAASQS